MFITGHMGITTRMTRRNQEKPQREKKALHLGWIPGVLFKPRATFRKIIDANKPSWLTPLLLLTFLVVIFVLLAAPVRREIVQSGSNIPQDFQYWSQDQQQQFLDAQANLTSPAFMYVFPFLGTAAGYWVVWFLFGSILYLVNTLAGSRASRQTVSNVVAWSMVPFALRVIVQTVAVLVSRNLITQPGLANLVPADATGFLVYLRGVLSVVDIYWVWHLVLLLISARPLSALKPSKAILGVLVAMLVLLLLQGLPSLLSSLLGGLSGSSSYYFYY